MSSLRPGGLPLVIELVGLPGSGKSSIARAVQARHLGRGELSILEARLQWPVIQLLVAALNLALSARPFSITRIARAFKLVGFLRYYRRHRNLPIIMDQGLAQKLWSMLAETQDFSLPLLTTTIRRLAPFAADHLIWVETPAYVATDRIVGRTGGNSRFDGLPRDETAARLVNLVELYNLIIGLFEHHTDVRVLSLRGVDPVADNAARIDLLIEDSMKVG
ncbi:MAG TPA: hypothetical protein VM144_03340 [Aestuariivirga sp.]|nr:hypothetical protein [Aestuariivirga sp.]